LGFEFFHVKETMEMIGSFDLKPS